jgi:hypothetical protein
LQLNYYNADAETGEYTFYFKTRPAKEFEKALYAKIKFFADRCKVKTFEINNDNLSFDTTPL